MAILARSSRPRLRRILAGLLACLAFLGATSLTAGCSVDTETTWIFKLHLVPLDGDLIVPPGDYKAHVTVTFGGEVKVDNETITTFPYVFSVKAWGQPPFEFKARLQDPKGGKAQALLKCSVTSADPSGNYAVDGPAHEVKCTSPPPQP